MSGQAVYSKFLDMVVAVTVPPKDTPDFSALTTELYKQIQANTYSRLKVTTLVLQTTAKCHSAFHPALAWLKDNWPAAASASPLVAPTPAKKVVLTPTVSASPSPSPTPAPKPAPKPFTPAPTPSPSSVRPTPTPAPTPTPTPPPVVVQRVIRPLMRGAAEKSGGTVAFTWDQSSMFGHLNLPADSFEGFCAAAVGQWFKDPVGFKTLIQSQKGKIDTLNLHTGYSGSGKASYTFLTATFTLAFIGVTEVAALTRDNLWTQIITHKGSKRMIGVLAAGGGGHALGMMTNSDKTYSFFDANEGVCDFANHTQLHTFLYHYLNDPDQGLLKSYNRCFVATWT